MTTHAPPTFTRGETPTWTYPCGCIASALRLAYCPLHAAAGEMREALSAIVAEWFTPDDSDVCHVDTYGVRQARALLARIGG
jgi:hypothetical protein